MKALVYHGPGKKSLDEIPIPKIENDTDAVIKLSGTTICGSDLHILKGDVPDMKVGCVLGHEGIGYVYKAGSSVSKFKEGDKVLISCISSCGNCSYCKRDLQGHCLDGGIVLGYRINGTQAEYVRVPHADHTLHDIKPYEGKIKDEALLMLSDVLPTGNEIGVIGGRISKGDIVAIIGAGSIGISTLISAKAYEPSLIIMIDVDDERLRVAKEVFGADICLNSAKVNVKEEIASISKTNNVGDREGLHPGVDVAIEAVGLPQTFQTCQDIIAPGGRIANIGLHGSKVDLQLQDLWIKNINISSGLVNTNTTKSLLKKVSDGVFDPSPLVTHHFKFDQIVQAYDVFENSAKEKCIKVFFEFDK
jgi:alcohol dehydrogenase